VAIFEVHTGTGAAVEVGQPGAVRQRRPPRMVVDVRLAADCLCGSPTHREITRIVQPAEVNLRVLFTQSLPPSGLAATAEEVLIEVFPEDATDAVQCDGIHAAVDEREAEADDSEAVPEAVVLLLGVRVDEEPQGYHVVGKEAHDEDNLQKARIMRGRSEDATQSHNKNNGT